ncbi:MAG: 1-(5-phosphoribosyl)-5-[(5-phosphoribosylamino)methylideneamino]imidazole-4-carboxamide isomerase [Candidatus Abyssobacteria bacterium SURF_17]|uniref:1-(5-phosphoribosyl)-5-[(5-phosphoribosylamino)methylideneamino] imidazole-4-carboxamide isomerase n=1 Tax=Candidatus Abyssobacteria bacterium SURF_17 TaxID=2093361 RepID=A0A419F862_9BACT|nr:MAG: 1-(5-phosphoribosyl)-5-[(5-phosphoribosylamino)methylideneamino]imidazole-4-carboxamide isomerase [Candidatus Abyssubacteria bacterium SURF_17]
MILFPAIDLRGGRCVRLEQGKPEKEKVYSGDPAEVARNWVQQGAQWLHVVDLDGALVGSPQNLPSLQAIRNAVNIPIQFGGGSRTLETLARVLEMGINRVVLGTAALQSPGFLREACMRFGEKVAVGIDARSGKVAVKGWRDVTDIDAVEFGKRVVEDGAGVIIYTDIQRDGMLLGPNREALTRMADEVPASIIASGGISTLKDVGDIARLAPGRIIGMIIGKALYEGSFTLRRAIDIVATSGTSSEQGT